MRRCLPCSRQLISSARKRRLQGPRSRCRRKSPSMSYLLHLPAPQFLDAAGNVIVIEQSDGLVLIDSGGYFGAGQHVVRLVKAISPKPVKALVLTHYHSDHSFGASAILAEWPKADFIAQEATLRLMAEGRPPGAPRQPSKTFEETRANALKSKLAQVEDAEKAAKNSARARGPGTRGGRNPATYRRSSRHLHHTPATFVQGSPRPSRSDDSD